MFRRQHPKWDQNPWFVPETTSISQPLHIGVTPWVLNICRLRPLCSSRKYPYPPRKGLEIPEGGGFKGPGISEEGEGCCLNAFFSRPVSIFIQSYIKFCCLPFASRVLSRRKINLANFKHKMSIFVLVWFGILLLLESDHFPEKWLVLRRSECCGNYTN